MVLVVITAPGISDFNRTWLKRHSAATTRVCRTARDTVGHLVVDGLCQPAVQAAEAVDLIQGFDPVNLFRGIGRVPSWVGLTY